MFTFIVSCLNHQHSKCMLYKYATAIKCELLVCVNYIPLRFYTAWAEIVLQGENTVSYNVRGLTIVIPSDYTGSL